MFRKTAATALILAGAAALPATADAKPITLDAARAATVRQARQPSTFTADNLPVGFAEVPRRWEVYGGFCRYDPFAGRRVIHCWVKIVFPDWPGCRIFDKWEVRRRNGRPLVRSAGQWTSDSTTCPGDTTMTVGPPS